MFPIFTTLFLIGLLGLLAQALLGFAHVGHDQGHGGHGGHDAHAGHGHAGHGHGHAEHGQEHGHHGEQSKGVSLLWSLLSPLTLFSLCLGVGAAGLLLKPLHLAAALTALLAAAGGLLFYGLVVRPVWGLIFQFASKPALALEGTVAQNAEALTRFDATGKGLVRLNIDGQLVRILATLEPDDRAVAVLPGDKLLVTAVDGRTNSCRVSRL